MKKTITAIVFLAVLGLGGFAFTRMKAGAEAKSQKFIAPIQLERPNAQMKPDERWLDEYNKLRALEDEIAADRKRLEAEADKMGLGRKMDQFQGAKIRLANAIPRDYTFKIQDNRVWFEKESAPAKPDVPPDPAAKTPSASK